MLFLFIAELIHKKLTWPLKIYYGTIILFSSTCFINSPLVLDSSRSIQRHFEIFNEYINFEEAQLGLILQLLYALLMCGMISNLFTIVWSVLKEKNRELYPLIIAFPLFFISCTLDMLIGSGIISFVYTLEYSFFALLLAMDYILINRYKKLFLELENVNDRLETEVEHRTNKIQQMIDSINNLNMELEIKNKSLSELAERDSMTRLYNHAALIDHFSEVFSLAKRQNIPLGYVMMDIDHFKTINDTYGHPVGDIIIKKVAEALSAQSRVYDVKGRYDKTKNTSNLTDYNITGRYGGDEFGIVLPYCDENETRLIVARILERIRGIEIGGFPDIKITMSIGAVYWQGDIPCESVAELVHTADRALYEAKQQGRNRAVVFAYENLSDK